MASVTIQLPEGLPSALGRSADELGDEIVLAAAIDWYRRGLVSQGRAAEIAHLSRAEFIDALAQRKIEPVQIDFETLEAEIRQ